MNTLIVYFQRIATPFLRVSLGVVLSWIGALKFVDPSPVVGLLDAYYGDISLKQAESIPGTP